PQRRDAAPRSAISTTTARSTSRSRTSTIGRICSVSRAIRVIIGSRSGWSASPRTATRSARASAASRASGSNGRKCGAAGATCRRTISASTSGSTPPRASIGSRCGGRTASRRAGTGSTPTASTRSRKAADMRRRVRSADAAAVLVWLLLIATVPSRAWTQAPAERQPPDARIAAAIADARRQLDAGQPASAIATIEPVVSRLPADSPERREAVQVLGLSHYLAGHLAEAIPYLEEIHSLLPRETKIAYALGMAYAQTRATAKARDAFARVFHVAPGSAAAYLL